MNDKSNYSNIKMVLEYIYNVLEYTGFNKRNEYNSIDEYITNFSKELKIDNSEFRKLLLTPIDVLGELNNYKLASWTIEYIDKKDRNNCDLWMKSISDDNNIFKAFKEKAQKDISELKKSSTQMNVKQELDQEIEKLQNENNEFKAKEKPNIEEKKEDKKESINDEVTTKNKENDKVEITEKNLDKVLERLANKAPDKFNELLDDVAAKNTYISSARLNNIDIDFNFIKGLIHSYSYFKQEIVDDKKLSDKLNRFISELDDKETNIKKTPNEKEYTDQFKSNISSENKGKVQEDKESEEPIERSSEQSEEENNSSDDENIDAYNINNEEDSDEDDEIIFDDIDDNLVEEELPSLDELGSTIDNNKSSIISENDDKKIEEIYNLIKENKFIKIDNETMKKNNPKIISDLIDYFNNNRKKPKWFIYLDPKLKESIDDFYLDNKDIDKFRNPNTRSSEGIEIIKNILTTIKTQLLHNKILNYKIIKNIYNKIKNIKNEKDEELQEIGLEDFSDRSKNEIKKIISSNSTDIDNLINHTYMNELNSGRILNFIESSSLPYLPPVSYFLESMPKY